ncbi:MAG: UDP-N-acetylmuramyl-tripeptide synthetase [bacterium]|nr:UDP-N-acetylmuramyl-tripeptide synthetase [bacterium]
MEKIKNLGRKVTPRSAINAYHLGQSFFYSRKHGKPADQMIVIGIVGSKGKTTTANLLWAALSETREKVGQIGTANIRFGEKEQLNKYHMTMPGAKIMQRILAQMKLAGCKYVIMEVPSEGQTQYRHIGINFDILIFTNVTKEYLAAHKFNLEILHKHNKRVFNYMAKSKRKIIGGRLIPKTIIANIESPFADDYLNFDVDKKITFGSSSSANYRLKNIKLDSQKVIFEINNYPYHINIAGEINATNATGAIACARELGVNEPLIQKGFDQLLSIPGRMEIIDEGQKFSVFVDYAHEQVGMHALMASAQKMSAKDSKIITLLGAEGGGRDEKKRPIMGKIVSKNSDYIIISNVDPYKDDPMKIIEDIAKGAEKAGKKRGKDLFLIEDRRAGIAKALSLADKNDLVFITGKGAEQSIVINGKSSPWDDRQVVREELKKLGC